ncbi:MAG TPA: hypothetical protein VMF69_07755 [Gemmataceae bacterium]|nr:hypothetical protein [Gemmataceae bacterium]
MKESSTYQAILEEGRQEGLMEGRNEGVVAEAKKVLRLQGDDAFGVPDSRTLAALERINDLAQLEDLLRRLPGETSWRELLGPLVAGSRKGRRSR